jgi:hypothetical protein
MNSVGANLLPWGSVLSLAYTAVAWGAVLHAGRLPGLPFQGNLDASPLVYQALFLLSVPLVTWRLRRLDYERRGRGQTQQLLWRVAQGLSWAGSLLSLLALTALLLLLPFGITGAGF